MTRRRLSGFCEEPLDVANQKRTVSVGDREGREEELDSQGCGPHHPQDSQLVADNRGNTCL